LSVPGIVEGAVGGGDYLVIGLLRRGITGVSNKGGSVLKNIEVGRVEITALTDMEGAFFGLDQIFPGVAQDQWEPYIHRYPWAFADGGMLQGRVGSYLLRSPKGMVLVDTGVGPQAMGPGGKLLVELENAGVHPEDVDTVFLTHLHGDHLGWSVRPDGEPVFANASYVTQAAEWEISAPYLGRAIAALDELGVLELLDGEEPVGEELTAIPTPGHSPGHNSLLVSSNGEQALVSGDAIVHPAQATEPTWNVQFDMDKEQAARTREMLLAWLEADGITVAAGHIPGSGFGRIARDGGGRYWQTLEDAKNVDLPGIDLSRGGTS
jgi:glyoxylase-like metal-dependent hydrolase (beta-lactamase superfamily II)